MTFFSKYKGVNHACPPLEGAGGGISNCADFQLIKNNVNGTEVEKSVKLTIQKISLISANRNDGRIIAVTWS